MSQKTPLPGSSKNVNSREEACRNESKAQRPEHKHRAALEALQKEVEEELKNYDRILCNSRDRTAERKGNLRDCRAQGSGVRCEGTPLTGSGQPPLPTRGSIEIEKQLCPQFSGPRRQPCLRTAGARGNLSEREKTQYTPQRGSPPRQGRETQTRDAAKEEIRNVQEGSAPGRNNADCPPQGLSPLNNRERVLLGQAYNRRTLYEEFRDRLLAEALAYKPVNLAELSQANACQQIQADPCQQNQSGLPVASEAWARSQARALGEARREAQLQAQAQACTEDQRKAQGQADIQALHQAQAQAQLQAQARMQAQFQAQGQACTEDQRKPQGQADIQALLQAQAQAQLQAQARIQAQLQAAQVQGTQNELQAPVQSSAENYEDYATSGRSGLRLQAQSWGKAQAQAQAQARQDPVKREPVKAIQFGNEMPDHHHHHHHHRLEGNLEPVERDEKAMSALRHLTQLTKTTSYIKCDFEKEGEFLKVCEEQPEEVTRNKFRKLPLAPCLKGDDISDLMRCEKDDVESALYLISDERKTYKKPCPKQQKAQQSVKALVQAHAAQPCGKDYSPLEHPDPDDISPEIAAAMVFCLEKGIELVGCPKTAINYLFPEEHRPPFPEKIAPENVSMVDQGQREQEMIEQSAAVPSDGVSESAYTRNMRGRGEELGPQRSYDVDFAVGQTKREYVLVPERPHRVNLAQFRGGGTPSWFPGYFSAFPERDGGLKLVTSPSSLFRKAWVHSKPTNIPTNDIIVLD